MFKVLSFLAFWSNPANVKAVTPPVSVAPAFEFSEAQREHAITCALVHVGDAIDRCTRLDSPDDRRHEPLCPCVACTNQRNSTRKSTWVQRAEDNDLPTFDEGKRAFAYPSNR